MPKVFLVKRVSSSKEFEKIKIFLTKTSRFLKILIKKLRIVNFLGKIPWRRGWQPLQYSCLENPIDRGDWWTTVHRVSESDTSEAIKHASMCSLNSWSIYHKSRFTNLLGGSLFLLFTCLFRVYFMSPVFWQKIF